MSLRALLRILAGYLLVLTLLCVAMHGHASLRPLAPAEQRIVVSRWENGQRVARSATAPGQRPPWTLPYGGATTVEETTVAEGPLSLEPTRFLLGLVPGRDGIMAELGDKVVFATVDDLLAKQAYDHASTFMDPSLGFGTNHAIAVQLLAEQLGVTPSEVETKARVRRVRFERRVVGEAPPPRVTGESLDRKELMAATREAALYLARSVDSEGGYRYLVDPITAQTLAGYNWPRHAGTTYFLAQAAAAFDDAEIRFACLRAAARLRDRMMKDCGANKCIAEGDLAEVGSSSLALIAFAEIVRTGADASYRAPAVALALFLRSQQRADGELMHLYNRPAAEPIDKQFLYYTGEAALGLSRAHRITGDPEDLRAASRALSRLSGQGWSFFGSRYYFSEEHWTCQAMSDLWERAPNPEALAFCLRWHEYQRRLQRVDGDSAFDADGSFGFGPFVTPRVTPVSSRGEAAAAALDVLKRDPSAGDPRTAALLDDELRRAIAFVMRAQFRPGPSHIFVRPESVRGAFPGSAVDLPLRIDYVQHAGSMMLAGTKTIDLH